MISNLISRRSPSAVASATAGRGSVPTRVRVKTSQTCYHRNQQYSIVGLTNAAGTLAERYCYTAYGTLGIYAANGTVRTSSTYTNRYTYTGREWDGDLKLYHFRARWYDPATGGFVPRDPLGYVDGMSLYRGYFGVRGVDPSGRMLIRKRLDLDWEAVPPPITFLVLPPLPAYSDEGIPPLLPCLPYETQPLSVFLYPELLVPYKKPGDTCEEALVEFRRLMLDNPISQRARECNAHIFCDKTCTGKKNAFWGFSYTSLFDKSRAFVCLNKSNLDSLPHAVISGLILHELVHIVDLIDHHGCPCAEDFHSHNRRNPEVPGGVGWGSFDLGIERETAAYSEQAVCYGLVKGTPMYDRFGEAGVCHSCKHEGVRDPNPKCRMPCPAGPKPGVDFPVPTIDERFPFPLD